ncbi:hypothetical protein VPHD529_0010 [Vibrio phage D529]
MSLRLLGYLHVPLLSYMVLSSCLTNAALVYPLERSISYSVGILVSTWLCSWLLLGSISWSVLVVSQCETWSGLVIAYQ